jgi:hypothetical protein
MLFTGVNFKGAQIIALPSDLKPPAPKIRAPRSIEINRFDNVAKNSSPFTGEEQVYDWMQAWWTGQVSFAPMERLSYDYWSAFIQDCRGGKNVFLIGDPKAGKPKGTALGTPLVNGANQAGFSLATKGWQANAKSILLPNDYIQIGYRLYSVCDAVDADSSGNAAIPIWPPLRDLPADGTAIITRNCRGLFRLKDNQNKSSVNVGAYGQAGFGITEAL